MTLINALITNGLLQFGQFHTDGVMQPFAIKLDLLASYPDVLELVRDALLTHAPRAPFDRILCPLEALPLAVSVSLKLQIPVVYARRRSEAAVFDLVGAYDIGHPTLVIANWADDDLMALIDQAERVGLRLSIIWAVMELTPMSVSKGEIYCLLRLHDVMDDPLIRSQFASGQIDAVRARLFNR
jgi:hypothetical protein